MIDPSLTYGELIPGQLSHLLSRHKQTTFIDLGSGYGQLCKEACSLPKFKHILGLEIHPQRIAQSFVLKEENSALMARCEFHTHDLYQSFDAIPSPAVVYLCATCFTGSLMQALAYWLTDHSAVESIIALKPLPLCADQWSITKIGMVVCTWDNAVFYQYDKHT